jgi:hypothetical protein
MDDATIVEEGSTAVQAESYTWKMKCFVAVQHFSIGGKEGGSKARSASSVTVLLLGCQP